MERLFAETLVAFGPPDIVVNKAGVFSFQPLEEIVEAEFHRQFDVPCRAGGGETLPDRRRIDHQHRLDCQRQPGSAALDAVTLSLAVELGGSIRVDTIAPGAWRSKARAPMVSLAVKPNSTSSQRPRLGVSINPPTLLTGSRVNALWLRVASDEGSGHDESHATSKGAPLPTAACGFQAPIPDKSTRMPAVALLCPFAFLTRGLVAPPRPGTQPSPCKGLRRRRPRSDYS